MSPKLFPIIMDLKSENGVRLEKLNRFFDDFFHHLTLHQNRLLTHSYPCPVKHDLKRYTSDLLVGINESVLIATRRSDVYLSNHVSQGKDTLV